MGTGQRHLRALERRLGHLEQRLRAVPPPAQPPGEAEEAYLLAERAALRWALPNLAALLATDLHADRVPR